MEFFSDMRDEVLWSFLLDFIGVFGSIELNK